MPDIYEISTINDRFILKDKGPGQVPPIPTLPLL